MAVQHFRQIIDRYLSGDATPEEIRQVEEFIRLQRKTKHTENITGEDVDNVLEIVRQRTGFDHMPVAETFKQDEHYREPAPMIEMDVEQFETPQRKRHWFWAGVAACIDLVAISVVWLQNPIALIN